MDFMRYMSADRGFGGDECPEGLVCFEDGSTMTEQEFRDRNYSGDYPTPAPGPAPSPQPRAGENRPPQGPMVGYGGGGVSYQPQFRPGMSTSDPEMGNDFAVMMRRLNDPNTPRREIEGNGLYGVRPNPTSRTTDPALGAQLIRLIQSMRGMSPRRRGVGPQELEQ